MAGEVDVVEVIKKSFSALVDEPGFIGIYLLPSIIPISILVYSSLAFEPINLGKMPFGNMGIWNYLANNLLWVSILFLSSIILATIAMAGVILKAEAREGGKFLSLPSSITKGIRYVPQLLATLILYVLITMGPLIVFLLIFPVLPLIAALGFLIWIIPMIFIGIRLSLSIQACVIEDLDPIDSLKKGWQVTKGNFWLIFVIIIVFGLISMGLNAIFILVNPILGSLLGPIILGPATFIAFTIIYLNLSKKPK